VKESSAAPTRGFEQLGSLCVSPWEHLPAKTQGRAGRSSSGTQSRAGLPCILLVPGREQTAAPSTVRLAGLRVLVP